MESHGILTGHKSTNPAPTPPEIPIPSVGGVWIFSGTAHCYKCSSEILTFVVVVYFIFLSQE